MIHFIKTTTLLTTFMFASGLVYGAENLAGQSIAVQGQVETQTSPLKRGTSFYSTDIVSVGPDSAAQLKFIDGGLLNLVENTKYQVTSYIFTEKEKKLIIELIEGGFRAMTGTIGKEAPTNYTIRTPVATIGVRGTIFDVLLRNGELSVGSINGTVEVTNDGGTASLPAGSYVSTNSPTDMGEVTTQMPLSLSTVNFSSPPGGESLVQAQATITQNSIIAPINPITSDQSNEDTIPDGGYLFISESEGNPPCG